MKGYIASHAIIKNWLVSFATWH